VNSKLALGTVQFGLDYGVANHTGQVKAGEARRILDYSKKNKIKTLDTASAYGESERVLGEIGVNDYEIITKTSSLTNNVQEVVDNLYKSLDNLKTNRVEGLLIHDTCDVQNKWFDDLFGKLRVLQNEGLIGKIGFSTYMPEQIDFLLRNFEFELIQLPFNVFDVRLLDGGQLNKLQIKGVVVHARSVFLQGLLVNFDNLPDYFRVWEKQFQEYQSIVSESRLSLLEYALNFVLNIPQIDKVLVGVTSESQLNEIVNAVKSLPKLKAYPVDDINLLNPSLWSK